MRERMMMIRGCRRGRGAALTALACATCVVLAVLAGPVGARADVVTGRFIGR